MSPNDWISAVSRVFQGSHRLVLLCFSLPRWRERERVCENVAVLVWWCLWYKDGWQSVVRKWSEGSGGVVCVNVCVRECHSFLRLAVWSAAMNERGKFKAYYEPIGWARFMLSLGLCVVGRRRGVGCFEQKFLWNSRKPFKLVGDLRWADVRRPDVEHMEQWGRRQMDLCGAAVVGRCCWVEPEFDAAVADAERRAISSLQDPGELVSWWHLKYVWVYECECLSIWVPVRALTIGTLVRNYRCSTIAGNSTQFRVLSYFGSLFCCITGWFHYIDTFEKCW